MAASKKIKTKKTVTKPEPISATASTQPSEPEIKTEDIKLQTEEPVIQPPQPVQQSPVSPEEKTEPVKINEAEAPVLSEKEAPKTEESGKEPVMSLDDTGDATTSAQVMEDKVSTQPANEVPNENPLDDFKKKMETELNLPDKPQKNYMWPILFIFIFAIALFSGVFAYRQGVFQGLFKAKEVAVKPTPVPPTATPEPTIAKEDLSKFEIQILNGSEVSGEASRQKDALESAGFSISSIGNADESNFTDTIIQAKPTVDKAFIAQLKSALEKTFETVKTEALDSSSSVPVVVILGTKK